MVKMMMMIANPNDRRTDGRIALRGMMDSYDAVMMAVCCEYKLPTNNDERFAGR